MKKNLLFIFLISIGLGLSAQTKVSLAPSQDNTLYESSNGSLSNGASQFLFSGSTNQPVGPLRRAALQFDFSSLPSNIVISSVTLTINVNKQKGGSHSHSLHTLSSSWGESTSNAASNEGSGTTAATGDVTWLHRTFSTQNWTTAGGDFNTTASATTTISGTGSVSFSSTQLTADVQNWITNPSTNHGWILIGEERNTATSKRFASKEHPTASLRPKLDITYTITSLTESESSKLIQVYPNPAEDYVIIENRKNMFQSNVIVHDIEGKEVLNQPLQMDNKLDLSGLKTGVYFIELISKDNNERIVKKIVKQ